MTQDELIRKANDDFASANERIDRDLAPILEKAEADKTKVFREWEKAIERATHGLVQSPGGE